MLASAIELATKLDKCSKKFRCASSRKTVLLLSGRTAVARQLSCALSSALMLRIPEQQIYRALLITTPLVTFRKIIETLCFRGCDFTLTSRLPTELAKTQMPSSGH